MTDSPEPASNLPAVIDERGANLPGRVEQLRLALDTAETFQQVRAIKDAAKLIVRLCASIRKHNAVRIDAAEIEIRAMLKIGTAILECYDVHVRTGRRGRPSLADIGLPTFDRHVARIIALTPPEAVEEWIQQGRNHGTLSLRAIYDAGRLLRGRVRPGSKPSGGFAREKDRLAKQYAAAPAAITMRNFLTSFQDGLRRILPKLKDADARDVFLRRLRKIIDAESHSSDGLSADVRFEDDAIARRPERQHRGLPPERISLTGSSAARTAER